LETVEELEGFLTATTREGVRGRLLARGEARAIMRDAGQLPLDAPPFAQTIDTDLAEYGFLYFGRHLHCGRQGAPSSSFAPDLKRRRMRSKR